MTIFLHACADPPVKMESSITTGIDDISTNQDKNVARFSSFSEASIALHNAFTELDYDTSEGDHALGMTESFLADSVTSDTALFKVNTSWNAKEPLGSYQKHEAIYDGKEIIVIISRLDAIGPWFDCRNIQIELLSDAVGERTLALFRSIRKILSC